METENVRQLTELEAIEFAIYKRWQSLTLEQRGVFQLYQENLCMPFREFRAGIEAALGRSVWPHEIADQRVLQREYEGLESAPTAGEICADLVALGHGKQIIAVIEEDRDE